MKKELTPNEWLRILTSNVITANDIALCEGCHPRTAKKIVMELNGGFHRDGTQYTCGLDDYLEKYKHTNKTKELRAIYGDIRR